MKAIPLSDDGSIYTVVDDRDFAYLNQFRWSFQQGYARRMLDGVVLQMHVDIMKTPTGMMTDHKDLNTLNNLRDNLRLCTHSENMRNKTRRTPGLSKFKGVTKCKGKFIAICSIGGKQQRLGTFCDELDAAAAYNTAALKEFGEFARLNDLTNPDNPFPIPPLPVLPVGPRPPRHLPLGEEVPRSTLTNEMVLGIVAFGKDGYQNKEIAKRYGIDPSTVSQIRGGKRWAWLTGIRP